MKRQGIIRLARLALLCWALSLGIGDAAFPAEARDFTLLRPAQRELGVK